MFAAWFYDTQVLSADIFVAMGAAAVKTDRTRLGDLGDFDTAGAVQIARAS